MSEGLRKFFVVLTFVGGIGFAAQTIRVNGMAAENASIKTENQKLNIALEAMLPLAVAPISIQTLDGKATLKLDRVTFRIGTETTVLACGVLNYGFAKALSGVPVMVVNSKQEVVGKVVGEIQ